MAGFRIPKGKDYRFTVTVLERNSFLPKNLATMDTANSSFSLVKLDTLAKVVGTITIARIADDKLLPADPTTYNNGLLSVFIPAVVTSTLLYERGEKIDGYNLKPMYQGVINVKFIDPTSDIVAVVPDIIVVPTGA